MLARFLFTTEPSLSSLLQAERVPCSKKSDDVLEEKLCETVLIKASFPNLPLVSSSFGQVLQLLILMEVALDAERYDLFVQSLASHG